MGPSRFPFFLLGNDHVEVSDSGRTGGESDSMAIVVH